MSIWWLVGLSVAVVLISILVFRLHAFLTLLLAGLLVAALTSSDALRDYADGQVAEGKMPPADVDDFVTATAPNRLAEAFGETAGKIGIIIALASIIGGCLLESGAASVIVDSMLRMTGEKRAPEALAASSFVLGIPVFFDTVFYLMVPLARSLRRKLGRDYVLFLMAILAGGSIAHSLVPPTPGPLQVAEIIGVDVGTMLVAGLAIGACTSVVSLAAARVINHFVDVPLREDEFQEDGSDSGPRAQRPHDDEPEAGSRGDVAGPAAFESAPDQTDPESASFTVKKASRKQAEPRDDKSGGALPDGSRPSHTLPPLVLALLPILLPVVLLAGGSVVSYFVDAGKVTGDWTDWMLVLGDKNVALGVGCVLSFTLVRYCAKERRATIVTRSLASAGNIILITAAGGAFGAMLRHAGIASAVSSLVETVPGLMLLPVAFAVTAAIRTLQGSATVAMITAAGVLQGFVESLPFHAVYLAMAIGAGSKPISWMTDSAFWVITRMSGMTEAEGLRVISPMSTAMGLAALLVTMLFASIYPAV